MMRYAVAADHAGFSLKATVVATLQAGHNDVVDLGTHNADPVDYPDFALAVAEAMLKGEVDRGVLVCGSGVGAAIAACKVPGIRAATCHDTFSARQGVEDDDMNVLCLGARVIGASLAIDVVSAFMHAQFSNAERHARRVGKVQAIETRFLRRE